MVNVRPEWRKNIHSPVVLIGQTVTYTLSIEQTAKSHLYILYFGHFEKIRSRSQKENYTRISDLFFPMLIFYWSKSKLLCEQRFLFCMAFNVRGTQRQFSENICSEDDLRSRIFGTFFVKFLASLPLLGFSNI